MLIGRQHDACLTLAAFFHLVARRCSLFVTCVFVFPLENELETEFKA
jgi:hypothetical protein